MPTTSRIIRTDRSYISEWYERLKDEFRSGWWLRNDTPRRAASIARTFLPRSAWKDANAPAHLRCTLGRLASRPRPSVTWLICKIYHVAITVEPGNQKHEDGALPQRTPRRCCEDTYTLPRLIYNHCTLLDRCSFWCQMRSSHTYWTCPRSARGLFASQADYSACMFSGRTCMPRAIKVILRSTTTQRPAAVSSGRPARLHVGSAAVVSFHLQARRSITMHVGALCSC